MGVPPCPVLRSIPRCGGKMGGGSSLLGAWGDEMVSGGEGKQRGGEGCCWNGEEEVGGQGSSRQKERVGKAVTYSQVSKPGDRRLLVSQHVLRG